MSKNTKLKYLRAVLYLHKDMHQATCIIELSGLPYLCEAVLHNSGELLPAVGREVQQLGAAVGVRLEPRQDAVRQVQSVGNACR